MHAGQKPCHAYRTSIGNFYKEADEKHPQQLQQRWEITEHLFMSLPTHTYLSPRLLTLFLGPCQSSLPSQRPANTNLHQNKFERAIYGTQCLCTARDVTTLSGWLTHRGGEGGTGEGRRPSSRSHDKDLQLKDHDVTPAPGCGGGGRQWRRGALDSGAGFGAEVGLRLGGHGRGRGGGHRWRGGW